MDLQIKDPKDNFWCISACKWGGGIICVVTRAPTVNPPPSARVTVAPIVLATFPVTLQQLGLSLLIVTSRFSADHFPSTPPSRGSDLRVKSSADKDEGVRVIDWSLEVKETIGLNAPPVQLEM